MKSILLPVVLALALGPSALVAADDPVLSVQRALKSQGFYNGETDGRVNDETRAALRRFQIRAGLKVTGETDTATLQALAAGAPAPGGPAAPPAATESMRERARSLEKSDRDFLSRLEAAERDDLAEGSPPPPVAAPRPESDPTTRASRALPPTPVAEPAGRESDGSTVKEIQRYIESYVRAAEAATPEEELSFFGERVDYFDSGRVSRQFIRNDQLSYYRRWPRRDFTLLGAPTVEWMEGQRAAVRFRLRYALSNERERASGMTENLVQLRRTEEGLKIVGMRERKLRE